MKAKLTLILILTVGIFFQSYSQQMPLFSQYKKNQFFFNPALAGAHGYTDIALAARNQWLGFKNPPQTMVLSGEGRLLKTPLDVVKNVFGKKKVVDRDKGNVGIGGAVFADDNAAISRVGAKACYAYHIKLPELSQVSFGLSFSGYQMKIDRKELKVEEAGDPLMNQFRPSYAVDFTAGVFYMKKDQFYTGISCENAIQTINLVRRKYQNKALRHYYLVGGYTFYLTEDYRLETSTIMQFNEQTIPLMETDASIILNHRNKWWFGISYRTTNDLIFMGGVTFNSFLIGYSFDYGMGKLITHTYGSHEISILYRLGSDKRKFRWRDRY